MPTLLSLLRVALHARGAQRALMVAGAAALAGAAAPCWADGTLSYTDRLVARCAAPRLVTPGDNEAFVVCVQGSTTDGFQVTAAPSNRHRQLLSSDRLYVVAKVDDGSDAVLRVHGAATTGAAAVPFAPPAGAPVHELQLPATGSWAVLGLNSYPAGVIALEVTGKAHAALLSVLEQQAAALTVAPGLAAAAAEVVGLVAADDSLVQAAEEQARLLARLTLQVVEPVTGALRVGVAIIGGGAAARSYAVRPSPLNPDVAVVEDQGTGIDAEVVLGYARFFRRHTPDPARFRGAATVAVGVTSLTAPKLDLLQSVHLGVELGYGDLSIGPAFVIRKVPALPGALQPGSVVKPGTTLSPDSVWQPGVALGIYATSLFKGGT